MQIRAQQAQIEALYIGYFGRSSDPAGLASGVGQLDGGLPLLAIANSFAVQPEATALYPFLTSPSAGGLSSFLGSVYSNLFNRPFDAAGLAYWSDQVNSGKPVGRAIQDLISRAPSTHPRPLT